MKKTTYSNYNKLFSKSFLLLLLVADFVFAADKCAIPSNSAIEISLSITLPCDGISLNNCVDENIAFLESKNSFTQKSFLILEEKTVAMGLLDGIKNLRKVFYFRNGLFFGVTKDGYVSIPSFGFVDNDQTEIGTLFTSLVSPKDECNSGLGSKGRNVGIKKNFILSINGN